ncbi:MAG: Coenzyme F420 hydrogenase/dehydrogenase, beta subunit C-terminal domain, partial [Candidatus Hydrothermarchaeales archaeon]
KNPFGRLYVEIIKPGVCTLCGSCVASCPVDVLEIVENEPKLVGKCIACGVCYNQCPKTITKEVDLIGPYNEAYSARTLLEDVKGQDGGAVTSTLVFALEEGLIDGAVVTMKGDKNPWMPVPKFVNTRKDIVKASGSVFNHSITLRELVKAIEDGNGSVGFVGTPCNIEAVYKMQTAAYGLLQLFMRANVLKLGLMCMDSFEYEGLKGFLKEKGVDLKDVEKMGISKGKLRVTTTEDDIEIGIKELDQIRSSSCSFCTDFSSEKADISFGSIGSPEGYTTVLTRTTLGSTIFHEAVDNGYIDAKPMEKEGLEQVLSLARMKKVHLYTLIRRSQK